VCHLKAKRGVEEEKCKKEVLWAVGAKEENSLITVLTEYNNDEENMECSTNQMQPCNGSFRRHELMKS